MTMLLTEIVCLDTFQHSCIIFAADRRISKSFRYFGLNKKIFQIPNLNAGIGFFGLAEIPDRSNTIYMGDWLMNFIRRNSHITVIHDFAHTLSDNLNTNVPNNIKNTYISGFHIAGYNSNGIPEFWFVRNVRDDRVTVTGIYEPREDFLRGHAQNVGYNGSNPNSAITGRSFIYRNGDIRSHVDAWNNLDNAFKNLLQHTDFKTLKNITDYENWIRFKFEIISYFYKKYCNQSIIGRPIDTFHIEGFAR